ncbi:MAG TPA: Fe-Mn family superoxide dismutase [Candidatus Paceibacterota bacterium]|nr:Fe-Mn family superoxide dismutase [Candidatus Paceibacterota bacterium]
MNYTPKNFDQLLGLEGFSDKALTTHFALYQGYVNNTNKLLEKIETLNNENKTDSPEFAEIKRRFGWEFNGMRLHEYYFEALNKESSVLEKESVLYKKIESDFESFENWEKDFKATASSRGIGWVILYHDSHLDKLLNVWVNEHDVGHLAGASVILNIDVFEHAFMIDYGTKRVDYVSAFMKAIDWKVVEKRFGR